MDMQFVDPAVVAVWRWQALLRTLFVAAASTVGAGVLGGGPWLLLAALIVVISLTLTWTWPPLSYRHLRYGVDEGGITIESGVLWRSSVALPRARIQHTDVSQGPIERHYGVGTLKLYTAGSRYTRIELPGLAHGDAEALRDALLARGGDSGV